jgi:hypothetical protein
MLQPLDMASSQWPEQAVPHLYLLPDLTDEHNADFAQLAADCHDLLAHQFNSLVEPVPTRWWHATVRMLSPLHTTPPSPGLLRAVVRELQPHLDHHPPLTLRATPLLGPWSVRVGLEPSEPFTRLVRVCAQAASRVLGPEHPGDSYRRAHITAGYCHTAGDGAPLGAALRALGSQPLRLSSLFLVMAVQRQGPRRFEWAEPLATLPLGGAFQQDRP